ncbi:hypothetical protein [Leuconostoc lactis]|uniref:hypothetical protein n=1 Tax=Leuconostoc lactis TaxID=1246 RepID=UPI0010209733|nr:hypothetical protein [Leuconostoc lactis]MSB65626.1 hypothetical protein [Leuconostoc lactis]RYS84998.1 hypothetical protein EAI73_08160 [Leuconostoc lactis]
MTDDFKELVTNYFKNDYRERGKIKWNGYFLSDHTSSLKLEATDRLAQTPRLATMPLDDIKDTLMHASVAYHQVIVQQDVQDQAGHMHKNITGTVTGFSDRGVVIDKQHILFETIRAVKEVASDD